MKKRVLIVECNAKIGGIQKALISLLKQISDVYEITLLLLHSEGALLQDIPADVRVIETKSDFRYMGMAQADCISRVEKIQRGLYVLFSRVFSRRFAVRLATRTLVKDAQEEYDVAIAYSHMGGEHTFFAGAPEYVFHATKAKKKLCYIHCDYLNSGNRSPYSDFIYSCFDAIACVSESTKARFVQAMPSLSKNTFAVKNPIDSTRIIKQAQCNTVVYDENCINLVSVARLTAEKGIARFVRILSDFKELNVRYWIVGDGPERDEIERLIVDNHLEQIVVLCGEENNPYRYLANADLLIVPSYHEAAPVVFQEAKVLNVPILTKRSTSADEMVGNEFGFVVDNDDDALKSGLKNLLSHPEKIYQKRAEMKQSDGEIDEKQEMKLIEVLEELMKD